VALHIDHVSLCLEMWGCREKDEHASV
jgi:hypothetical protein